MKTEFTSKILFEPRPATTAIKHVDKKPKKDKKKKAHKEKSNDHHSYGNDLKYKRTSPAHQHHYYKNREDSKSSRDHKKVPSRSSSDSKSSQHSRKDDHQQPSYIQAHRASSRTKNTNYQSWHQYYKKRPDRPLRTLRCIAYQGMSNLADSITTISSDHSAPAAGEDIQMKEILSTKLDQILADSFPGGNPVQKIVEILNHQDSSTNGSATKFTDIYKESSSKAGASNYGQNISNELSFLQLSSHLEDGTRNVTKEKLTNEKSPENADLEEIVSSEKDSTLSFFSDSVGQDMDISMNSQEPATDQLTESHVASQDNVDSSILTNEDSVLNAAGQEIAGILPSSDQLKQKLHVEEHETVKDDTMDDIELQMKRLHESDHRVESISMVDDSYFIEVLSKFTSISEEELALLNEVQKELWDQRLKKLLIK